MENTQKATAKQIMDFFGGYANVAQFRADWSKLSDMDKAQLAAGIGNGSLTY